MTKALAQLFSSLALCLVLAACSSGPEIPTCQIESRTLAPQKATSRPYQINGIWYYPQPHYEYIEEGIASFYGGGDVFHGRKTATGEIFDMNGETAAHPTLPLPCIARVTNLENGREICVKVNDRGPFIEGRMIDVSRRVAQLLGFENKGLANVRVETLVAESLALNGIASPTIMLAKAPSGNPEVAVPMVAAPATALVAHAPTSSVSDPETLFDALAAEPSLDAHKLPSTLEDSPPITETAPVEVIKTQPRMIVEKQPSPSVVENNSPLPVKLEAMPSTGIFVHVGNYETQLKAQSMSRSLQGMTDLPVNTVKNTGPKPYAISLGPLFSMSHANQLLDQLMSAGHTLSRIVIQQ